MMKLFLFAIGILGMWGSAILPDPMALMGLGISLIPIIAAGIIWEIQYQRERALLKEAHERWANSKPKCIGGKGVNIYR